MIVRMGPPDHEIAIHMNDPRAHAGQKGCPAPFSTGPAASF